jgi:RimJ/RimL family protein N-acetyltransferase
MELHNMSSKLQMPSRLEGNRAVLIPLDESHISELYQTAKDDSLWTYYVFRKMGAFENFKTFAGFSIAEMEKGSEYTFTIIDKQSGKMIGGTSFLDIQPASLSLEIGRTWIAPYLQGTGFNVECKLLLLTYCFEDMGLIRVFFKTDSNNTRSKKALEKIGAKYEGTFRNHMIRDDGTFRHSAYYSIIREEWDQTKKHLKNLL